MTVGEYHMTRNKSSRVLRSALGVTLIPLQNTLCGRGEACTVCSAFAASALRSVGTLPQPQLANLLAPQSNNKIKRAQSGTACEKNIYVGGKRATTFR